MTDLESWPELPYGAWADTCETLHLWMQVVGKVALATKPFLNEYWQVAFSLRARGLNTGVIPLGGRGLDITFDFLGHELLIDSSDGDTRKIKLRPRTVADFYDELLAELSNLGLAFTINPMPTEIPNATPLDQDRQHASYDADSVERWWRILVATNNVLQTFRSTFAGKSSPIHFFWGSFDLAHSRFSGRPAPLMSGVPRFFRVSEDQENYACGFWPGNPTLTAPTPGEPTFYAYGYPAPEGIAQASIRPAGAGFDQESGEFVLPYSEARMLADPAAGILEFFTSTYEAVATVGGWNRKRLEISGDS